MSTDACTRAADVRAGQFSYMDPSATPSLRRNGKVFTRRDADGSDAVWTGVDLAPVQMPVHNARTLTGSDRRSLNRNGFESIKRPFDLSKSPRTNDTWRPVTAEHNYLLDPDQVKEAIATGRFGIINLWRNIATEPVATNPMALCDGRTVSPEDLVVFEIHYADRIGENYFARHADRHRWYCYPAMTREEALLITQWDSAGELARTNGAAADYTNPISPCTFSFHSAFEDPTTPDDAPDRWSIEVRCAVLYF